MMPQYVLEKPSNSQHKNINSIYKIRPEIEKQVMTNINLDYTHVNTLFSTVTLYERKFGERDTICTQDTTQVSFIMRWLYN